MKRSLFFKPIKGTLLAVPACALMLGAAQAGTTIGLNFQSWYYDSHTNPQTVGYGAGYQTTGFPVTARAFGVNATNWFNTDPLPAAPIYSTSTLFGSTSSLAGGSNTFAGTLTLTATAPDAWQSGIGEQVAGWNPETVAPGNNEVTWAYLDGNAGQSPSATISGLAAKFPNGYAVLTIAAENGVATFNNVDLSDGVNSGTLVYSTYYVASPQSDGLDTGGTVGLSSPSSVFTGDTLNINPEGQTSPNRSTLAGFIITDQPVISRSYPASTLVAVGGSFVLNGVAVGIGNLAYQWQHDGTNIPGAIFDSYTNAAADATDSGDYQLIVTSDAFPSYSVSGDVLTVTVVPSHPARTATWDADILTPSAQDGSGTWSNTATNWWSGSFDDYWGSADSAVFGAGGTGSYTVTLSDNITANALTFDSGDYTITNEAGQSLTLNGSATITMNANATITCPLSTTNTLDILGSGTLTLSGAMASASTMVDSGTLVVLAKNGDSPYVVTNGATLKIGYSTGSGYASTSLQLYGDGTAATTGLYLKGGTTYNVNGGVVVNNAPTTIRQFGSGLAGFGTFDINQNPGLSITAAASGTILDSNIAMVNDGYGMVVTTAAGTNEATGDLVLDGPLSVSAQNGINIFGLIKRGNGSIRLNAPATATNCCLNLSAGSVICGAANCIGTNAVLKVAAGTTLNFNGTSQTVSNAPTLAGTLMMSINKGGTPNGTVLKVTDGNPLNFNGNLVVTSVGSAPAIGDSFTLFDSTGSGFGGAFNNVTLPTLANGQGWLNNLAVDGTISVVVGSVPPSIVTDLSSTTNYAYAGIDQTFAITASGDPTLQYQWYKNGTLRVGLNSPTLVLPNVTTASSGYYSCFVTNNYGVAYSQSNYLLVIEPALAAAATVQDTPGAFWPLNETNTPTAYDYSGAGNNGTQNGNLTLGVAGPTPPACQGFPSGNTAYLFDGSSSYIDCGTGPSLSGATDFTLEAWVNTTNNASSEIIQQRSASGYNGEYQLGVNANGTITFMVYGGGASQFNFTSPATSKYVNDGNWHHVAAVRSGNTGTIYIDGSAVASATGSAVAPLDPTIGTYIGADLRSSASYFGGMLCNVAIYTRALAPARIAEHALAGVLGTSPLLIGSTAGGFIEDSKPVGTLHYGLNYGTTWQATNTDNAGSPVTRTGVAQFPLGRQIAIPANSDFNTTTGTICFWVRATTIPASGNGTILFDCRTTAGTLMFFDSNGYIDIQTAGGVNSFSGGNLADGNWHHLALTYDQSSGGTLTVYQDGQYSASQANTAAWSWPTNQEIELGRSHDPYWQNYNGQMDDFRIYNRILTATEIGTVFSGDALVDTSALKLRFNFDTPGVGKSLTWPVGALQGSPALTPASWMPVSNVDFSLPYLTPAGLPVTTNSALFYRAGF